MEEEEAAMMLRLIWTGLMMIMVQVMGGSSASGVRTLSSTQTPRVWHWCRRI